MNDKTRERAAVIAALRMCCGDYTEDCTPCPFANGEDCGFDHGSAELLLAAANLLERDAEPTNDPLTLDELREMWKKREAVYVCNIDRKPVFGGEVYTAAVLDTTAAFGSYNGVVLQAIYGRGLTLVEGDYGKTWLAYRRKPEGGGK